MESLHAPWRIEYILSPKRGSAADVFSRIGQSNDDEGNLVVARRKTCYAMLNTFPYSGGHLLVVPYKECADLNGLNDDESLDLLRLTRDCQNALSKLLKPDGFNVGMNLGKAAGAGVPNHLHIHIVPRWQGDTNFMPVLASTSVLPQALSDLAKNLRQLMSDPVAI